MIPRVFTNPLDSPANANREPHPPELQGSDDTFGAPFLRAYAPALAPHAISQAAFLDFLDGLNEAFLPTPALQGTGMAGMAMGQCYGLEPVQLAGCIVEVASGVGSAAVSYWRTRAYVRAMNERLFHPTGLQVDVLSTAKMLRRVGMLEGELPAMESRVEESGSMAAGTGEARSSRLAEDVARRRMQRLEGYCAPLEYDVPASVPPPDGWLRRMNHTQAARLTRKRNEKTRKKYDKADEEDGKERRYADRERRKVDKKVARIEGNMAEERAKLDHRLTSSKVLRDPKEVRKVEKEYEKEMLQLQREVEKGREELARKERERGIGGDADGDAGNAAREKSKRAKLERKLERKEAKGWEKMQWVVIGVRQDAMDDGGNSLSEEDETAGKTLSGR